MHSGRFIPLARELAVCLLPALDISVYPRWRGNSGSLTQRLSALTVYPAGAGNSGPPLPQKCHSPVYPRWRGELAYRLVIAPPQLGLSPLARELSMRSITVRPTSGLSPLARGTQLPDGHSQTISRFIPAGAGNSLNLMMVDVTAWTVYPRWRGELCKHNLLLINDFLSQSQSTNFTVSHKQHIHYVKEYFIH